MLPRPPKAVIFDMDGLLIDSEIHYRNALMAAGAERGLSMTTSLYDGMLGQPWSGNAQLLMAHYGAEFDAESFRPIWLSHFNRLMAQELRLKPGVVELLDLLDRLGLPRAIATSSAHHQVEHHLADFDLIRRFDTVVAQGDYKRGKPAPDPYLVAADRLGIATAECLALEDSHNGIRSASSAGMMAVMVPDLLAPTDEIAGLCAHVAESLLECLAFFEGRHEARA
ncbi:HAD family hydrolase [Rhizobium sp. SL42]|uniref:HAD family hydrolase n=1 Tax=Rhizobium sp. SL42 TaxID=2806346 RepID=UPI001F15F402|nr:HAD family phosphatase [Rhizobium sp. SL42]UJW76351.1 HAD family phosphatase [Rhizobium sp. SL42]